MMPQAARPRTAKPPNFTGALSAKCKFDDQNGLQMLVDTLADVREPSATPFGGCDSGGGHATIISVKMYHIRQ